MRRSFVKLVVMSVLALYVVGLAVMFLYLQSMSWTEEKVRSDGVFLLYELLDQTPATSRAARLETLQANFNLAFALISLEEVEERIGRKAAPGDQIPLRVDAGEEWFFLVFEDGQGALAAGPVNPAVPPGAVPIGVFFAIVGIPMIAILFALRVERGLTKVEKMSQKIAVGELSARVDNHQGPVDELAQNFNAMAERVEQLIRSRDELIQAVSHELGSPLSRLRFHRELLENQADGQEERLSAMADELDALDELVAELLSYVQSDEVVLDRQTFDPIRSLSDLAELARLEIPEDRAVEVELKLTDGVDVFADQRLFQRAVENILRNAVRHAHNKVMLELTEEKEHVRVTVHDDGIGIPEELHEKVKVPFFRLQAERGRKTGGAGLGLAIVSRIMQRHKGRFVIANSPLGGARVEMLWPSCMVHKPSSV